MRHILLSFLLALPLVSVSFAQQQMTASGEVVAVRTFLRTMTVRDGATNEAVRYNVPVGTVTIAGQRGQLGHLRNGDRVEISYVDTNDGRRAASIRVPEPTPNLDQRVTEGEYSTVTGRLVAANYGDRTITVLGDQSGEQFTYRVPEATRVTIGGETTVIGRLQRGDQVTLRFREQGGQRQAARVRVPQPVAPLAQRQDQTPPAGAVAQQQAPRTQLPRTAGHLPLLALAGVLALLGAGSLRLTRRIRRR
jgi:cold shock CspA family protein